MGQWQKEATALVREEREQRAGAKEYTQPIQVSWHEFLHWEGLKPAEVEEMPDDDLFLRWSIYQLKVRYSIPL